MSNGVLYSPCLFQLAAIASSMDLSTSYPRRRLLAGGLCGFVTVSLAGCTDSSTTDESTTNESASGSDTADSETTDNESDDSESSESTSGQQSQELDLREANVVDVELTAQETAYTFDVTLHHDDNGEDGYANWWQVEQPDSTQLGRRELAHPHSQQPFTRSETIDIPSEVSCVVVRGHDQTHGYGGQAMVVTLDSGATRAVDQGHEPATFDEVDCP